MLQQRNVLVLKVALGVQKRSYNEATSESVCGREREAEKQRNDQTATIDLPALLLLAAVDVDIKDRESLRLLKTFSLEALEVDAFMLACQCRVSTPDSA